MRPSASCAKVGAAQQEVQGTPRPAAICLGFLDLWEILRKFVARTAAFVEKSLEVARVGYELGGTNSVSQVNGELRFGTHLPPCWLGVGLALS